MATDLGNLQLGTPCVHPGSTSYATFALDASTDMICWVTLAPKAGTIDRVGICVASVTGTSPTYRIGLQSLANGSVPDGTWLASGAGYTDESGLTAGYNEFTLDTAVTVTAGQEIALVIQHQSGTIDGSNYVTVNCSLDQIGSTTYNGPFHKTSTDTGSSWSASYGWPVAGIRYNSAAGDMHFPFLISHEGYANVASGWISSGDPLYRGIKFTAPFACQLTGITILLRCSTSFEFNVKVFEGSGSSPMTGGTTAVDPDRIRRSATIYGPCWIPVGPLSLTKDTVYRIVLEPTTVNGATYFFESEMANANAHKASHGILYACTSPSAISWTDYDNGTDGYRAYPILPAINEYTAPAGGGGGGAAGFGDVGVR